MDLARHPDETTDSAGARPDLVEALRTRLAEWERELLPPTWVEGAR